MPTLELGSAQLHYELIEGDLRKPLLVFLHEGLGCIRMWKEFPERLCAATGCAGLVYERQGYGQSSPQLALRSIHYLHQFALAELPAVMERLAPGREHIVVGHSDGGSIALIYAAGRPQGLRGVLTAAAHVFVEDVTIEGIQTVLAAHSAGKMRALAVSSAKRIASLPDVPTVAETGLPGTEGFEADQWYGLVAPAGTPAPIVAQLNQLVNKVLAAREVRMRLATEGADPSPGSPQVFGELIAGELKRWQKVVKAASIKAD